jgi:parallel beta-helix repeat protein
MRHAVLIIVVLCLVNALGFSATLIVPNQYPTIQAGIDAAQEGDLVLVLRGTYFEHIDFKGKGILVKGHEGASDTVIDGMKSGDVVTFTSGEGRDSTLTGFTLTNGDIEGIHCEDSSPTILENIITKNRLGIYVHGGSPAVVGNTITHNSEFGGILCKVSAPVMECNEVSSNYSDNGGGITCHDCDAAVVGNLIQFNVGDWGGGIMTSRSDILIEYNSITHNIGGERGGGIAISGDSGSVYMRSNWIAGNTCYGFGGGIYSGVLSVYPLPMSINNIIVNNTAKHGGGIFNIGFEQLIVVNNTVYGNTANESGGGAFGQSGEAILIYNSIFWHNIAPDEKEIKGSPLITHCDVEDNYWAGKPHCFNKDPLFVDSVDDDFHLTFASPCKDKGDNTVLYLPSSDFEDDPRMAYGTVDIGADEFHPHLYITGSKIPGGTIKGKLVGMPGTSPNGLLFGTGLIDPPVLTQWGYLYLQAPWFLIPLVPIPGNGVLVLPAAIPASPPAPYDLPLQALIGLEPDSLTNLYVLEVRQDSS